MRCKTMSHLTADASLSHMSRDKTPDLTPCHTSLPQGAVYIYIYIHKHTLYIYIYIYICITRAESRTGVPRPRPPPPPPPSELREGERGTEDLRWGGHVYVYVYIYIYNIYIYRYTYTYVSYIYIYTHIHISKYATLYDNMTWRDMISCTVTYYTILWHERIICQECAKYHI